MLRKSSKCEKGKRLYNGDFTVVKCDKSDITSSSIDFVSHFIKKVLKNAQNCNLNILNVHRDMLIQSLFGLYHLDKPVFYFIRLASIGLIVEARQLAITNKIIKLTKLTSSKKRTKRQKLKVITLKYELISAKLLIILRYLHVRNKVRKLLTLYRYKVTITYTNTTTTRNNAGNITRNTTRIKLFYMNT